MFTQKKTKCGEQQCLCTEAQLSGGPCSASPLLPSRGLRGLLTPVDTSGKNPRFCPFSFLKRLLPVSQVSGQEEGEAGAAARGNGRFHASSTPRTHILVTSAKQLTVERMSCDTCASARSKNHLCSLSHPAGVNECIFF